MRDPTVSGAARQYTRAQPGVMVGTGVRVRQGFEGGGGLAENVACLE
jgi:hypothetical protein